MYRNIREVEDANRRAGYFFFTPETMRFFRSRVHDAVYGAGFFVTSEQYEPGYPRLYTVRFARPDGSVASVSAFQQYASRSGAHAAAAGYAKLHADGEEVLDEWGQRLAPPLQTINA